MELALGMSGGVLEAGVAMDRPNEMRPKLFACAKTLTPPKSRFVSIDGETFSFRGISGSERNRVMASGKNWSFRGSTSY